MNNDDVRNWYANRVPLSGTLSDYALLVGQNNRALQTIQHPTITTVTTDVLKPNPNRVCINVGCSYFGGTDANLAFLQMKDQSGNILFVWTLFAKEADVATVTPSPFQYQQLTMNVKDWGNLVQRGADIFVVGTSVTVYVSETIFVPKCCEYIGASGQGSQEPQAQEYFADKQARRR